jgi:hypothetical protein
MAEHQVMHTSNDSHSSHTHDFCRLRTPGHHTAQFATLNCARVYAIIGRHGTFHEGAGSRLRGGRVFWPTAK